MINCTVPRSEAKCGMKILHPIWFRTNALRLLCGNDWMASTKQKAEPSSTKNVQITDRWTRKICTISKRKTLTVEEHFLGKRRVRRGSRGPARLLFHGKKWLHLHCDCDYIFVGTTCSRGAEQTASISRVEFAEATGGNCRIQLGSATFPCTLYLTNGKLSTI